jgi:parallel beta-helix repeat protein
METISNEMNRPFVALKMTFIICISLNAASATIWYVHPDSTLNSISAALNACNPDDTILVGAGVYNQAISWPDKQGIDLISEYGRDTTVVNGHLDFFHPVDTTTVVHGFTIQNGYASYSGGGIYIQGGSPIISHNTVAHNRAGQYGGGIYVQGGSPIILNNVITGNRTDRWGGGIAFRYDSSPVIAYNTIENNQADENGGGIFSLESSPVIFNNLIRLNSAGFTGGGINCWRSSAYIRGNTIIRNMVGGYGAGIYCWWSSPDIDSCSISSNSGDGVYCEFACSPTINYCNFIDNVGYAVYNTDSTTIVDAQYNWWGDATGPYHPDSNPGGIGDTVSDYVDFIPWLTDSVTWGIEEFNIIRPSFKVVQILPNPFHSRTNIIWQDSNTGQVELKIYNAMGRVVREFDVIRMNQIQWDGTDDEGRSLPDGIYFVFFKNANVVVTEKIVLLR